MEAENGLVHFDKVPVTSQETQGTEFDKAKIIDAALIGIVTALAFDLGVALAGGPPLTKQQVIADIISGAIGGAAGEIVIELTGNNIVGVFIGAFLTGVIYQLITEQSPEPPGNPPDGPRPGAAHYCPC
ncbi:MAG TPA: hypothetical protein GXX40_05940 [Firmicutes bacterium]|nr:hypothetical protein [Bacillota bacterium]